MIGDSIQSGKNSTAQQNKRSRFPAIGLLLSERLHGMPKSIAAPLTRALFDEVSWATEDEVCENVMELGNINTNTLYY